MRVPEIIWSQVPDAPPDWRVAVKIADTDGTATKVAIQKDEETRTIFVRIS